MLPVSMSFTYTHWWLCVLAKTRLVADAAKHTNRPSSETSGSEQFPLAATTEKLVSAKTIVPLCRSARKTSFERFVSPGTRTLEPELKTTKRPSTEARGTPAELV